MTCAEAYPSKPYLDYESDKCISCYKKDKATPAWDGSECVRCEEADPEKPFLRRGKCISCFYKDPSQPILVDGECKSCEDAYPDRPYQDKDTCVAARPHKKLYMSGIIIIAISFVAMSGVKVFHFYVNETDVSGCQTAAFVVALVFVVGAGCLLCLFAFIELSGKWLWLTLCGIAACLLVATVFVGLASGIEDDEDDF